MKTAVIGAGPAGLTAAYQLSKKTSVDLYEAADSVGGMSKTIDLWGQKVDLGPHRFFSNDKVVNELWLEVAGQDYEMVDRLTRILYNNKFFHYPLKPFNALSNLGIFKAAECMLSFGKERIVPSFDHTDTFESWVVNRFGRQLFDIFFKTYSEKLWGIGCDELDADFAAQRIKKLSLYEAVKSAFLGNRGNKHKTLVDQFAYPTGGTGMVYDRMAEKIEANGSRVLLQSPIQRVVTENGRAIGLELANGEVREYDHIISSMPLTQMVRRLDHTPPEIAEKCKKLKFRNTILVYLRVEGSDLFPDNWLYVHMNELRTGRITNFRNWVPQLYKDSKDSILVLEYWCNDEDEFWSREDDDLINLARKELKMAGLNKGKNISEGKVVRIPKCYPVYGVGYKDHLEPVVDYLKTIKNLSPIGRYGAFKYNNQDHSILMGIRAAENITENTDHDLWNINTDDEYQENSVITKTGLLSTKD